MLVGPSTLAILIRMCNSWHQSYNRATRYPLRRPHSITSTAWKSPLCSEEVCDVQPVHMSLLPLAPGHPARRGDRRRGTQQIRVITTELQQELHTALAYIVAAYA